MSRVIECHSPCNGTGVYLDKFDVFACPRCGDISYADNVTITSSNVPLLSGGDEDDFVRVVGKTVTDELKVGPAALIKAPYEAREDIKDLSFRKTERKWSEEFNHWLIWDRYRRELVDHMDEAGWGVVDFVRLADREETKDA